MTQTWRIGSIMLSLLFIWIQHDNMMELPHKWTQYDRYFLKRAKMILAWYGRWNISSVLWIYLTNPCEKEPRDSIIVKASPFQKNLEGN